MLDLYAEKHADQSRPALWFTIFGILLTILGAFLSPIAAGCGNAFFHSGGGVLSIQQDRKKGLNGKGLGVFVAPGAFGVFLGSYFAKTAAYSLIVSAVSIGMIVLSALLYAGRKELKYHETLRAKKQGRQQRIISALCFMAVMLRSCGSMAIAFPWKSGFLLGFAATACIALGKAAGGFSAARFTPQKTAFVSLILAAVCYSFGKNAVFGLLALFFFNMTMPLTLHLEALNRPDMPGFAFGLLTFGLFVGYLPFYYGIYRNVSPVPHGALISVLTLIILAAAYKIYGERS